MFFFGTLNTLFTPRTLLHGRASGHVAQRPKLLHVEVEVCCLCDTARPGVVVPTLRMRNTAVSYGCTAIKPAGNNEMSTFEPAARHSPWSENHVTFGRKDTEHTVGSKQQKCVV